ncbi:MAG: hypothetical protein J3R72DRAFT_260642, partial [Linnemannia gamsii]
TIQSNPPSSNPSLLICVPLSSSLQLLPSLLSRPPPSPTVLSPRPPVSTIPLFDAGLLTMSGRVGEVLIPILNPKLLPSPLAPLAAAGRLTVSGCAPQAMVLIPILSPKLLPSPLALLAAAGRLTVRGSAPQATVPTPIPETLLLPVSNAAILTGR